MLKRTSSIMLVAMLLIGMAIVFPVKAATTMYIDPASNVFYTDTKFIGDTFTVNVMVSDVANLYAYEFKVIYEPAKINLTGAVRPAGHFLEPALDPGNQFVPVWKIKESEAPPFATGHFGFTLLAPEAGRTGSGLLVTLTFKIMSAPTDPLVPITSTITLSETKLADTSANPIVHTAVNGTYEYWFVEAPPPPSDHYLSINPALKTIPAGAPIVGTPNAFFDVYVDVNDLYHDHWIVGIEFKLAYDPTLLDFTGISVDPWLDAFGDIFLVTPVEGPGTIHTAVVLLPHSSPPSIWTTPIFTTVPGSGHLVKLTFEVIHQEAFPWIGESPLDLYDALYSNTEAESVPGKDSVDGLVRVNGFVVGRNIDLYTCSYPEPYNGAGPFQPADMFWPQKEVCLCADVTYNLWPEQNKIVAFEIHNPAGEIVDIITAISDENGVACTSYRIPWPCFNTSALFGIWTVIATVDIACIVVNDTMQFHFDYMLGQWWKVTTDKTDYAHGEVVHVCVDYATYAIQYYPVLFTAVLHDELNYPVAKQFISGVLGDLDLQRWCQYANGTVCFDLPIEKFAHAGIATIRINALSDFPWLGGSAWGPETSITITILPE